MNTSQLECCIESVPALRSYVIGVYAADHLSNRGFNQPYGLIVNTDIHSKSGQLGSEFMTMVRGKWISLIVTLDRQVKIVFISCNG